MKVPAFVVLASAIVVSLAPAAADSGNKAALPKLTTLKAVMPPFGVSAHRIQTALWREDYYTVAKEARSIVRHAELSKQERERIADALHGEFVWFREANAKVYRSALAIAEAAEKKNAVKAAKALGEMQEGCAGCHMHYRARLRQKP